MRQLEAAIAERSGLPSAVSDQRSSISTGWPAIDLALAPGSPRDIDSDTLGHVGRGGLVRSAIHEWFASEAHQRDHQRWSPPLSLLVHLAWRAIDGAGLIVWIGRRTWPHASALGRAKTDFTIETQRHRDGFAILDSVSAGLRFEFRRKARSPRMNAPRHAAFDAKPILSSSAFLRLCGEKPSIQNLLPRSIFVNPPDEASRLWAMDLALRSEAVNVVVADGSRLKMAQSRRLQLAAERGHSLALLARPVCEEGELSAAATRWRVRRTPSPSSAPRWIVELLRCKYAHQGRSAVHASLTPALHAAARGGGWEVEYAAPGHLRLVADVVDRSAPKSTATATG